MAKDLDSIGTPAAEQGDITLDTLFNTGVGADRKPPTEPANKGEQGEQGDDGKKPPTDKKDQGTEGSSGATGQEGTDSKSDADVNEETKAKVKNTFAKFADDSDLSDEDRGLRQQLLETYKGEGFNENGDIVDKDGNVVKSFDDVYNDVLSEEDQKFDDDGNLIDDDGKIIKTKAQLDAEKSYVNKLAQETGYEFKDENGNPKTYADNEEGLQEFVDDLVNVRLQEQQEQFFSQNPTLAEISKHLLTGGTLEDFQQSVDYDKIDVDNLTETQKLAYIEKSFKVKGFNDARIQANLQRVKDGNQVDEELKFAFEDLKAHEKAVSEERDAKLQEQIAQQERENAAYWNEVQQTITQGKVKELTIPEQDKVGFFEYLARPVKNNLSQAMLDRKGEDIPTTLMFDYLRYKGYDLSKLVDSKAKTTKVNSLRDLIARASKVGKGDFTSTKGASSSKKNKAEDLTIDQLLG